jgi:DNA polymerase-3 subunit delta'
MADPKPDTLPEPDRLEGAPHPRETGVLYGHDVAQESDFPAGLQFQGRLHHAWMLTGPKGVGKATLAWRIARFLLATPEDDGGMFAAPAPDTLDIPPITRWPAGCCSLPSRGISCCAGVRTTRKPRSAQVISVDEVRKMKSFFALSAADGGGGRRSSTQLDEMNTAAANALLKLLEEPPANVTFLLVAHQPAWPFAHHPLALPRAAPDAAGPARSGRRADPSGRRHRPRRPPRWPNCPAVRWARRSG